jgi:glyceraldehyde-3-phosphate dehydrogenase/erythrose-4-phosphate dehydrogenase
MVYFETPKINRNKEPLLREHALRDAVAKARLEVVMIETFGTFAESCQLSCYQTNHFAFDKRTLNSSTLHHASKETKQTLSETPEALDYSQNGHWVVVLCKPGRTKDELKTLRNSILENTNKI